MVKHMERLKTILKYFKKPDQLAQFNCCSLETREGLQHPCWTQGDNLPLVGDERWRKVNTALTHKPGH